MKTVNELRDEYIYDEIIYFGQLGNLFSGKFADPTLEFLFFSINDLKKLFGFTMNGFHLAESKN